MPTLFFLRNVNSLYKARMHTLATHFVSSVRQVQTPILFIALLAGTALVYWPGLTGPFLFDDISNLREIALSRLSDLDDLLNFALSGKAGPLGRPIALLSFALNDTSWPSDPWSFKYTNVMLHLLNGVLLCWLVLMLARIARLPTGRDAALALIVTALWLLHPLNLSSVLFVIQRMTELMALFTLAGLLAYIHGRSRVKQRPWRGYLWMSLGIGAFGLLATLSKENGALLPLYALLIEFFLLRPFGFHPPVHWHKWAALFLYLPLALIATYFIVHWDSALAGYAIREYGLRERLLTEARVLMDYLVQFIVPRVQGSGLFHDDYSISRSLLDPPQTFGALVAISALLVGAVRVRYKLPVLSFGILWFFAGHLLESTFLPLEIYFEHRNYLPLIGLLFALAYCGFTAHLPFIRGARITLILFISLLTLITWQQARVWGHGQWLAEAWAQENPASVRAQQLSANFWVAQGKYEKARHRLRQVLEFHPNDLGLRLELIQIDCLAGKSLDRQHIEETIAWLPKGRFDNASTDTLRTLVEWHTTGRCPQLTVNDLHRLLDAILANARFQTSGISLSNLYYLQGQLYAAQGHLSPAVEALDKAFVHRPNVDVVLRQALWLASAGLYNDALQYIEKARQVDQRAHTLLRNTREEDIDALQQLISRAKNPASSDRPQ